MKIARRRLAVAGLAALAVTGLGLVAAAHHGVGPLVPEQELRPEKAALLGEGGDPLVLMVGVPWSEDGYCDGQFTARAIETATEVRVGAVISRVFPGQFCDGLGTIDDTAWVGVHLAAPVGNRTVVRADDNSTLPVR
ncbi:hypothetical protein OHA21_20980 [Actinoplanes sp. NBC_00393]|uniref:hypothetical protein n=1 Tax=Actinoplanes sp. NBC_00393 TaxID=2975953 RepID=UPI002E1EBB58